MTGAALSLSSVGTSDADRSTPVTSVTMTEGSGALAASIVAVSGADSSTGITPVTARAARAARREVGAAGWGDAGIIGISVEDAEP